MPAVTVVVPTLEGLPLDGAKQALSDAGLQLGTVIQRNDKSQPAGTVLEASETAESEVAPRTVVNLVVASGKVTLTDVTGWTVESAEAQLTDIGLVPTREELGDCPATDPPTVVSMSSAPGDVDLGATIALRFCTGAAG